MTKKDKAKIKNIKEEFLLVINNLNNFLCLQGKKTVLNLKRNDRQSNKERLLKNINKCF